MERTAPVDDVTQVARQSVGASHGPEQYRRDKLVTWLKVLENRSANQASPTDPIANYDFGWLWRELGVESLRR